MKLTLKILAVTIPLLIFSGQVLALKCGNRLVGIGDGKVKVFLRCGEPDFKETRERRTPINCLIDRYSYNFQICRVKIIDVWTYNFGSTRFMRELAFIDGVLEDIKLLEYGY